MGYFDGTAEVFGGGGVPYGTLYEWQDYARQLERRLAEAEARADQYAEWTNEWRRKFEETQRRWQRDFGMQVDLTEERSADSHAWMYAADTLRREYNLPLTEADLIALRAEQQPDAVEAVRLQRRNQTLYRYRADVPQHVREDIAAHSPTGDWPTEPRLPTARED